MFNDPTFIVLKIIPIFEIKYIKNGSCTTNPFKKIPWNCTKYLLQILIKTFEVIYFIQDFDLNSVHLKYCAVFSFEIDCTSLFYWYISDTHP